jgi:hypothetical protein
MLIKWGIRNISIGVVYQYTILNRRWQSLL